MNSLNPASIGGHDAPQPPHSAPHALPQHQHPHAMYQMGVVGGLHGGNNPQFPPQNLYIPPISQHGTIMAAQTSGFVSQGIGHGAPVYTNATLGIPTHHQPHPMMGTPAGIMPGSYYQQRPLGPRSGGSPNSGDSPSPGSDDSDDSTPAGQGTRAKRPSPEVPVEPLPAKGKKARVSKKSKKKKDPNEPQKPVSAYALFFRDTQAAIKGQNPNASFGEVSKIVASMWDGLDAENKSVYKKKTEAAKKEYLKALAAYRASLVSKGSEGDQIGYGTSGQSYPSFGSAGSPYGFPNTTNAGSIPSHPQGHTSPQLSPLAKKSPLLSSLMTPESGQQALMTPPMSQPMPPSAPQMISHGPMASMNQNSVVPQSQTGTPSSLMNPLSSIPSSSPYMTQTNPSLGSPVSSMGSDVGSPNAHSICHKPSQSSAQQHQHQQQQQQQQEQQQQPQQPQSNSLQQPTSQHQGPHQLQHPGSNQGGGHQVSLPGGASLCNGGSCIRSGCTNPAVHNPEWEDEYCSNECVVSHCRDVFNSWVASGQGNTPTYPAPVK